MGPQSMGCGGSMRISASAYPNGAVERREGNEEKFPGIGNRQLHPGGPPGCSRGIGLPGRNSPFGTDGMRGGCPSTGLNIGNNT